MFCYKLFVALAVVFASAEVVLGLHCFSCYGSGPNNKCEQYQTYETALKESDEKRQEDKLFKNCTEPFDQLCYIETYVEEGTVVSHLRDCGDGKTFTFNADTEKEPFYNRLRDMKPNNETVCVFDLKYMVCLSMCDTDLCNGPNEAVGQGLSRTLIFIVATLTVVSKSLLMR